MRTSAEPLEELYALGPLPTTTHNVMLALAAHRSGMTRSFQDSILARFSSADGEGYMWVTVSGLQMTLMVPFTMWGQQ